MDLDDVTRDDWTLIFVRELRQAPTVVWAALTSPEELDQWAPFSASRPISSRTKPTSTTGISTT